MTRIVPFLWYDDQAQQAVETYTALFPDSRIDGMGHGPDGSVLVLEFTLLGQPYRAMNGGPGHPFTDAVSLQVDVETQEELDRVWDALIVDGGHPVACGWLVDRWGLSWQVTPAEMGSLMAAGGDPAAGERVFRAMTAMVKLDIEALRAAAQG